MHPCWGETTAGGGVAGRQHTEGALRGPSRKQQHTEGALRGPATAAVWLACGLEGMCVLIREGEDAVAAELANEELEAATNPQPKRTLTFFGWHRRHLPNVC